MQIGELAKRGEVSVQTVRFYERSRLLPEPQRRVSGYRNYAEEDVRRLLFIRQAKALGFSLEEIRTILQMRERGLCPCVDVISLAERHLRETERQLRGLERFRSELARALRQWKRSGEERLSADAFCVLIERTMDRKQEYQRRAARKHDGR
ncbi:MAG: heavy metal-responsive transcriptional regulator [Terriglobales bacterium]